jgi:amphiphysin
MYKAENDVEQSTQEFNYYNDLLKDELPKLFQLEREFIRPLFQSFYYMQLNVFYTLHEKMQGCDIGYFNLQLDVEEGYEAKRGDIKEQAEALSIVKFKTTGARRPPGRLGATGNKLAIEAGKPSPKALTAPTHSSTQDYSENPPPPYSNSLSPGDTTVARANSTSSSWGAAAKAKGAAPPPPKPKPSRLSGAPAAETATALYDYEAQAEGDLSFTTGDVIEIVTRTNNENEWWIGKLRGKEGQFPGVLALFNGYRRM